MVLRLKYSYIREYQPANPIAPIHFAMKLYSRFFAVAVMVAIAMVSIAESRVRQLHGERIAEVPVADSVGDSRLWDFSSASFAGRMSVGYTTSGDTLLMELLPSVRSDFAIYGDSIWLTALEGRRWKCTLDSILLGGNSSDSVTGTLGIDLSQRLAVDGVARQTLSKGHRAVMAPGDTLAGISLFTLAINGRNALTDTLQRPFEVQIRYWLAETESAPIAIERSAYFGFGIREYYACIFPPGQQQQYETDSVGGKIVKAVRSTGAYNGGIQDLIAKKNTESPAKAIPTPAGACNADVRTDGTKIRVVLSPDVATADVVLCDIAGRVIESHAGVADSVSFDGLPPGDYLVSVSGTDWRITEKIHIR